MEDIEHENISKMFYEAEARACKAYAFEQRLKAKIDDQPTILDKMMGVDEMTRHFTKSEVCMVKHFVWEMLFFGCIAHYIINHNNLYIFGIVISLIFTVYNYIKAHSRENITVKK